MKKLVMLVLTSVFTLSLISVKSQALVGSFIENETTVAIGGAAALSGLTGTLGTVSAEIVFMSTPLVVTVTSIAAYALPAFWVTGVLGVVVLEYGGSKNIQFTTLDKNQALKLNLSENQRHTYNENVDIFNAIKDQIAMDSTKNTTVEEATSQWKNALTELNINKDAIVGLIKVSQQVFKK